MTLQDDLSILQGVWLQIGYERDGVTEPVDEESGWQPKTSISGLTFTVTTADGTNILEGVFSLDFAKQPKEIDWVDKAGSYASAHVIKAIYTLSNDEFVFCAAYDGAKRPTVFKTESGQVLRRMRRVSNL